MGMNMLCPGMSYWMNINFIGIVKGICLLNRKDEMNMTIIGELGVVYGVTGASVLGIKLLKKKGLYLPRWLLRAGLKCLLIGSVWYVLMDILDVFLR